VASEAAAVELGWSFVPAPAELRQADVRLRYKVAPDARVGARKAAQEARDRLLAMGAADVKLEADVEVTLTARAPDVATAPTTAEQLGAVWRRRGMAPDPLRETRLMAMLAEIEQEA
jgi:hypothetical protein